MNQADLIAALLWDVPALLESEFRGARRFHDAMGLRRTGEEDEASDELGRAAEGVLADLEGKREEALALYQGLAASEERFTRLLGLCLLLWSGQDRDRSRVAEAQAEIEVVEDPLLQARLTAKLIAAAFDAGWDDLLPELFEQAQAQAPEGSRLALMLKWQAHILLGQEPPIGASAPPDRLTDYQWISDLAAEAAESALVKSVEERTRSPWALSMTIGATPMHPPIAAEMQARWAGAVWMRAGLQKQLGAHLLAGGAASASEYASGVALWILGGGRQIPQIIEFAERHFDQTSADSILEQLTRSGPVALRFNHVLVETAVECWDLISPQASTALLERFLPTDSEHPVNRQIGTLWSVLSLRIPHEWEEQLTKLSDEDARGIVPSLSVPVAESLPLNGARRLYELATGGNSIDADALPSLTAIRDRLAEEGEELEPLDAIPPRVTVRLAWMEDELVDEQALKAVIEELTGRVSEIIAEALEGKAGFGTENPVVTLSQAIIKLGEFPTETLQILVSAATDPRTPRNLRYEIVKLFASAAAAKTAGTEALLESVEDIPEAGAEAFWPGYTPDLMRAAISELAVALGKLEEYLPRFLIASRSPEARIRNDAIGATTLARRTSEDELLELILLGAMFDPDPGVVRHALDGFAEKPPERRAAQAALAERLSELFAAGTREVRRAVARYIAAPQDGGVLAEVSESLRSQALEDRSFEVRREVGAGESTSSS